jgi:amino acid transporter
MPLGRSPKSYKKALPLSMPMTLGVLAVTYGIFAAAIYWRLSPQMLSTTIVPQIVLSTTLFERAGRFVAVAFSLLATFGAFNAGLMGGARMVYGLAREGSLPKWMAQVNLETGIPVTATLSLGGVCVVFGLTIAHFRVHLIAASVGAGIECLLYGMLILAVVRLRARHPQANRPFRSPVPILLQWAFALAMPLLGLGALLSLPAAPFAPALVFVVLAAISVSLAYRYGTSDSPVPAVLLPKVQESLQSPNGS